ncbi:hypothetical protein [Dyadobacter sp. 32]|uniref:hypothetical protein n=1 Tax=Dyadobacter sp. 32 TaxID=538966 RepID=UPI0039C5E181
MKGPMSDTSVKVLADHQASRELRSFLQNDKSANVVIKASDGGKFRVRKIEFSKFAK